MFGAEKKDLSFSQERDRDERLKYKKNATTIFEKMQIIMVFFSAINRPS